MVEKLLYVIKNQEKEGFKIAAVGPNYTDIKGEWDQSPFVKLKGRRLGRVDCGNNLAVSVDHLISSGCLIPMESLQEIGLMEAQLFIDYVDIEWCLRAKHKGYHLFGACSAQMQHDLGNNIANLFGRKIPVHSALRYYYLIRNGVWLLRQPWVSKTWRIVDARRIFIVYIIFSFVLGTKFKNWKMATIGLWHGLIGKMGKYQ
jgi:rhamnosyltransferase